MIFALLCIALPTSLEKVRIEQKMNQSKFDRRESIWRKGSDRNSSYRISSLKREMLERKNMKKINTIV